MSDSGRNVLLDSRIKEIRPRQVGASGAPSRIFMRRVMDAVLNLLFIESPADLLEEIARIVIEMFSMEKVIVWISEEKGVERAKVVLGFSEAEKMEIMSRTKDFDLEEKIKIRANWMSAISMFVPDEALKAISLDSVPEGAEKASIEIRDDPEKWQVGDYLRISFLTREGRITGALEVRDPKDGTMPSLETVRALEILASICSVAMELSRLRGKELAIAEAAERRSAQISQVLSFARDVLSLESPEKVLANTLDIVRDLFGFQEATISLFDEKENCFRYVAVMGYPPNEIEYAKTLRIPFEAHRQYVLPEFLIGRDAFYMPAEQFVEENLLWEIYSPDSFAGLKQKLHEPRKFPGAWHKMDNLSFIIRNRQGRVIGLLCPGRPLDGKTPSMETVDGISIFTSLISIALENAKNHGEIVRAKEEIELLNSLLFNDVTRLNMTMKGYIEMAAEPGTSREERANFVKIATKYLDSSIDLIQKIRRLSSIRSVDPSTLLRIDLGSVVKAQISKTAALHADRKISISEKEMPESCYVLANDLIGEMFGNILSNAVKHNRSENVEISVAIRELKDEFDNRMYWDVAVSDNGSGVPDEQKDLVFDIMSRTKGPAGERTGIGLSVSKAIVTLYGGSIWMDNRVPTDHTKGTVVHVLLPAA